MSANVSTKSSTNPMRLRASLVYTLAMLFLMIVAGIVGMTLGTTLGREALKGVTQPDFGLSSRTASSSEEEDNVEPGQVVSFLSESDILKRVKERVATKGKAPATPVANADTPPDEAPDKDATSEEEAKKSRPKQMGFPIVSKDGGVLMEVVGARPEAGSWVLDVNLRNEGTKPVRFLYSFLDVTDDRDRALSATAEDLPGELQPLSENFSGTIRIPKALVDGVDSLSVSLTDYPDQKIQLKLDGIPVLKTE